MGEREWTTATPPNETVVEVMLGDEVIQVMAHHGRDGSRPHWRTEDGSQCWDATTFRRWRHLPPNPEDPQS